MYEGCFDSGIAARYQFRFGNSREDLQLPYVGYVGDTWWPFVPKADTCSAEPQDPHPISRKANTRDFT